MSSTGRPAEAPPAPDAARSGTGGRDLRRALWIAGGLSVLGWLVVLIVWTDSPFAFTFDDAYYYFAIARNLASGHGSTFDQINQTNGYHPLWMAIATVPFRLGADDLGAARLLLILQLVVGWGASLLIVGSLVSREVGTWRLGARSTLGADAAAGRRRAATVTLALVFLLLTANPFIVKAFVNGLESGIAVTLYAAVLLLAADPRAPQTWIGRPRRTRLAVGGLLALTFLARTDAIIMIGCLGLWCLAEIVAATRAKTSPARDAVVALVELFAPAAVTIAAYLAYNQSRFSTPVQISGLVKRAPLDATTITIFALFVVVAAALGRHSFRRAHGHPSRRTPRFPHAGTFAIRTGWFAAFSVLIVGYYNVLQTQQWLWYYCPLLLYLLVLMILAVADIVEVALVGAPAPQSAARTVGPVAAFFVIALLAGLVIQVPGFVDPDLLSIQRANRDAGLWIRANLDDDAVLGSWDAGVVGYFADRHVVNLDGVVNSVEFHDATLAGNGVPAMLLRCEGLGYVVNHGIGATGRDPDIDRYIAAVYGPDVAAASTIIETVPFTYSGSSDNGGGISTGGTNEWSVRVYEIPPTARGPRNTDTCPAR